MGPLGHLHHQLERELEKRGVGESNEVKTMRELRYSERYCHLFTLALSLHFDIIIIMLYY